MRQIIVEGVRLGAAKRSRRHRIVNEIKGRMGITTVLSPAIRRESESTHRKGRSRSGDPDGSDCVTREPTRSEQSQPGHPPYHSGTFTSSLSPFLPQSKTPPLSKNAFSSKPASLSASSTPTLSSERPGFLPLSQQFKNLSQNHSS